MKGHTLYVYKKIRGACRHAADEKRFVKDVAGDDDESTRRMLEIDDRLLNAITSRGVAQRDA